MVVVLHLIALSMVGAGLTAVSFGSGIVSLERGWTMVISGTVVTSAGIVLLGIAAILVRLNGLGLELARGREEAARRESQRPTPPERLRPAEPAIIAPPVVFDDGPAEPLRAEPAWAEQPRADTARAEPPWAEPVDTRPKRPWARPPRPETSAPTPVDPPPPAEPVGDPTLSAVPIMTPQDALEPVVEPRHADGEGRASLDAIDEKPAAESGTEPPDDDQPGPREASSDPEPRLLPSSEPAEPTASFPEVEPVDRDAPVAPPAVASHANGLDASTANGLDVSSEEEAPVDPDEGEVVGSYSSGDNSYVMYADGSIKAQTPTGRYRFGSLDELKRFLAS